MNAGVLLISRKINLFPLYKSYFEEMGFFNVHITDKDKDGLNMHINELKPSRLFIASDFYSIGTPYMVGLLHKMFPKKIITAVTTDGFPDELAAWFIFHGAKSYVNFLDGVDEFNRGLKHILQGDDYLSPVIRQIIDNLEEWPDCNLNVTKRQKEILLMLCNGYSRKKMQIELQISEFTVHYHIKELMSIFHVHSREDLIKIAHCLDIVTKKHLCFYENKKYLSALPDWARKQIEINKGKGNR
jgi:DNA-binding CsgD family transcriptional regulator